MTRAFGLNGALELTVIEFVFIGINDFLAGWRFSTIVRSRLSERAL